jgi:hypothetical protein
MYKYTYKHLHTYITVAKPEKSANSTVEHAPLQFGQVLQGWQAKSPVKSSNSSQQNSQANSQSNSRRQSIDLENAEEGKSVLQLMQDEADAYDAPVDGFDKPMDIDLNSDDGEILQPQLQQEEQRQDGEETSAQDLSYEDLLIQQYAEKQTYEAKANEVSR